MKKKYYVENLGCAHCAMSMEEAVRKIDGVIQFQIHFAQNKMILEAEDENFSQIFEEVEKTCRSFETDVRFREKEIAIQGIDRKALVKILSSAVLFAFALLVRSRISPLLSAIFFLPAFLITGYGVLAKAYNGLRNRRLFDENFLMALASVGAFLIGEYAEGVAVMLLYAIGEFFQDMAVSKSRRNIADLMDIRPDHANLITDGKVSAVSPEDVPTGSLILVKPGEKIPLDGIITEGNSVLDTSSLTGESLPREVAEGERVISGCVNLNGVLTVRTEKSFEDSSVSKILALIEDDEGNRSKTERIITRFARIYTPIVVLLAFILAFLPPLFLGDFPFWIHKAITCLVISCPCALVISVPLSFFGAIGGASSRGILIKGADCLEKLANASVVAFDKTGTLTKGVFTVSALHSSRISEEDLLQIAATCEHFSDHPIALSLKKACPHKIDPSMVKNVSEIAGEGVEALVLGNTFFVGNAALMKRHGIEIPPCEKEHFYGTVVHVATKKEYLGHIIISDEVREDAEETLKFLRQRGIDVQLLSGDTEEGVLAIAKKLDVGKIHNSLLPQEKRNLIDHLKEIRSENESIVFVGDGTNDAPVLAKADVGIAMGGIGSDAAIEAADVVLMDDKTFKVVLAIDTAKKAIAIVWQNILLSVGTKLLVLIPTIFNGKESIPIWLAIFADVGVCLLAILNATRTLTVAHHDEDCHCGGHHEHHHHDEDCHCGEHHHEDHHEHSHK